MTTTADENRCTSTTVRGTRCRSTVDHWPAGAGENPRQCRTHLSAEQRAARDRAIAHTVTTAGRTSPPAAHVVAMERRALVFTTGAPACWSWSPTAPTFAEAAAGMSAGLRETLGATEEMRAGIVLDHWQAGRCAVCWAQHGGALVVDHDHANGLVRGLLCRSCNTQEANRGGPAEPLYAAYRERPPAVILGLTIRYRDPYTGEYARPEPAGPVARVSLL